MGLIGTLNTRKALADPSQPARQWRYPEGKRDLRLDFIRGLAVIVMVIDHVGGDNSWLYTLTGDNHFFISAAEPFVFVSGLVMGLVYSSLIFRLGLRAAGVKALRRSVFLYSLDVLLSIGLAIVSLQLALPWAPHWGKEGLWGFVAGLLTLHRTYYLTDVLLLYTLLVAVSIPLLALLSLRRRWATLLVLAGSWGLWLGWQFWPQRFNLPWAVADNGIFHFSSWQVLFVTGLVIGFHHKALVERLRKTRTAVLCAILAASGALVAGSIYLYIWSERSASGSIVLLLARLFEKADMRVGRVLVFAAFVTFAFVLLTVAWKPVQRIAGWLVLPLGQNALGAYVLHILFAAAATATLPALLGPEAEYPATNTAVQVAVVMMIWGLLFIVSPVGAFVRRVLGNLTRSLTGALQSTRRTLGRPRSTALPGAVLGVVVLALVIVPILLGMGALRGKVSRTLHSLNEEGQNTVVMVPTITVLMPGAKTSASTGGQSGQASQAPQEQVTATPTPQTTPLELAGTPMAFSLGPAATSTPQGPAPTPTATPVPINSQTRTFYSKALGRTMPYIVFLPPDYTKDTSTRFPVLYMLHGVGAGDSSQPNTEWIRYGLLGWADELMRANMIKQFIIVLPQGEQSYWVDQANGGPQWGAYVAQDLVAQIDSNFRTLAQRDERAIGGISMGGHAALQLPINYPDVFGIAGSDSPSLHTYDSAPSFFGDEAYFEAHDPAHLFEAHPEIARTLKLWIDVGQYDAWLPVVTAFHSQLVNEGIPHEWHVFTGDELTGGHTGEYWSTHIPDYLRFYSSAFGS